jgi:hypothetical protein
VRRDHPPDGLDPRRHSLHQCHGDLRRHVLRRPDRPQGGPGDLQGLCRRREPEGAYVGAGVNGFHGSFDFGGITWANYKGGGTIGVDTNKCHLFPTGVPGLFRTVYGPADYIETVNTPG